MGIQLKSVKVKALKDFPFNGALRVTGSVFNVTDDEADKLERVKRVERVKQGKAKSDVVSS